MVVANSDFTAWVTIDGFSNSFDFRRYPIYFKNLPYGASSDTIESFFEVDKFMNIGA